MTIAACFEFDDGILFCADTKITTDVKTNQTKIFPNMYSGPGSHCATVFAIAGSIPYAKAAIRECEKRIAKLDFLQTSMETIREEIETALATFYQKHVYPNPYANETHFELLAGVWLRGETRMFASNETIVSGVDGYECLGSGAYLARYWIRQFFASEERGAHYASCTIEDIGLISAYALNSVMEYDESCGGEGEFLVMTKGGEIGFGVDAHIYPCEELPNKFHRVLWPMLRKLVRATDTLDADFIVDNFVEEVRKIGQIRVQWLDMLTSSLKNSVPSKPSNEQTSVGPP